MKVRRMEEIPISKAKEVLEYVKERWGELKHFQQLTLDFLARFAKLPADKADELLDRLCSEFGLSRLTATQVVNIMPKSVEELRQILVKEGRTFMPDELRSMLSLIEEYYKYVE
ncbi:DNA-directed RNA polymerase subunit F [Candidatus Geothermarchaeota archaeon ex4572_27]|nr:MAG: DNA-directed RNA polymerase subunit F [Candidatus Geothermarchaeota archaeon ex4572_27]